MKMMLLLNICSEMSMPILSVVVSVSVKQFKSKQNFLKHFLIQKQIWNGCIFLWDSLKDGFEMFRHFVNVEWIASYSPVAISVGNVRQYY